ncbi:MAG TPA: alginate export family protein [Bryobacteraceae bacterium]|nr:alginate export family protein [Bryobacteraceae bacterium]
MRIWFVSFLFVFTIASNAGAQQAASEPVRIGGVTVSGWLRTRGEAWDWFAGSHTSPYGYSESLFRLSFSQDRESFDWKIEAAIPLLLGLPSHAVVPGAQGQLGYGASYYAANSGSNNTASIFAKQAYLRLKFNKGEIRQSLLVGRTEFFDGAEVTPKNPTLAALERDRIAQRLIGNFGFADVGRSFDGVVYTADGSRTNLTLFAARATRGVFQVDGWGEVNSNLFYGALTRQIKRGRNGAKWRVFGLSYNDYRGGVLKTDNRPQAVRAADHQGINIATVGGDYIDAVETSAGTVDFLFWGALQGGSWGSLAQRSSAFAAEVGWQAPRLRKLRPWLRGGYDYASGDGNPNDRVHGTFFQVLPTARQYARFPFFNMMNNRDAFGELILRPSKALAIRADIHGLSLASKNDLWYSGGGIFQPWSFGYTGRPANGHSGLATLYDVSADYTLNRHFAFSTYYARALGKLIVQDIYPNGKNANFGYVELDYRF